MKATLRIIGALGLALFVSLFALTYGIPGSIEKSARTFVNQQIESELRERYQTSGAANAIAAARSLAGQFSLEAEQVEEDLLTGMAEKIAAVIAQMCGYDCERKKVLADSITRGYLDRLANLSIAQHSLKDIIKGKYMQIVGALQTDLRIFLGTNALMFLVLLLVSFFKPQTMTHLFLPGLLLFISTIAASGLYIFGQNWFYTIIYNDYAGFGYAVWLGLIFGLLMDIVFNAARITTEIINAFFEAIGSAFSVVSC